MLDGNLQKCWKLTTRIDSIAAQGDVSQIDLDFGTTLHATLLEVIDHGKPAFHRIGYERKVWEERLRLLLPVRATDRQGRVIDQVFVTHFFYRGAS